MQKSLFSILISLILIAFNQNVFAEWVNIAVPVIDNFIKNYSGTIISFLTNHCTLYKCIGSTMAGALMIPLFSATGRSSESCLPFLKNFFSNRSEKFYFRADLIITAILMPMLFYAIVQPAGWIQAFALGTGCNASIKNIVKNHNQVVRINALAPNNVGEIQNPS